MKLKSLILFVMMLSASLLSMAWRPDRYYGERYEQTDLKAQLPTEFGKWKIFESSRLIVDPALETKLRSLYESTASAVYIKDDGYMVMLSLAYGLDQRGMGQVHLPEICYPAQGFTLTDKYRDELRINGEVIPITRLFAKNRERNEPITYWTTLGKNIYQGQIDKKLLTANYLLNGFIPDGMVVRVSSIDANHQRAYLLHEEFIRDFAAEVNNEMSERLGFRK